MENHTYLETTNTRGKKWTYNFIEIERAAAGLFIILVKIWKEGENLERIHELIKAWNKATLLQSTQFNRGVPIGGD